jgi:hypothetical protein
MSSLNDGVLILQAKDLVITKTQHPKEKTSKDQLVFGKATTDHILSITWTAEKGWNTPEIKPYGPIMLDPAALVFHYALAVCNVFYSDSPTTVFRRNEGIQRQGGSSATLQAYGQHAQVTGLSSFSSLPGTVSRPSVHCTHVSH